MTVSENLERVRREVAARQTVPVTIVGVTKFQPIDRLREAFQAGLAVFANNYAQDGEALMQLFPNPAPEWHFIGHIQSRKVKYLVEYDCVQSLDRLSVAQMLQDRLNAAQTDLEVLVEVNIGDEAQKSGIELGSLERFLKELSSLPRLKVRGLMGMPPPLEQVEERRPFFRKLHELYSRYREGSGFDCLSMGTSADYLVAVEEGATMIRLGTTLFGERPART